MCSRLLLWILYISSRQGRRIIERVYLFYQHLRMCHAMSLMSLETPLYAKCRPKMPIDAWLHSREIIPLLAESSKWAETTTESPSLSTSAAEWRAS